MYGPFICTKTTQNDTLILLKLIYIPIINGLSGISMQWTHLCNVHNRNILIQIPRRCNWSNLYMLDVIYRHLIRIFCIEECRNWVQMDHQGMEYIYDIVHMVRSTCIRCSLHNYPTLEHFPIQMLWKNMIRKKLNKAFVFYFFILKDLYFLPWNAL